MALSTASCMYFDEDEVCTVSKQNQQQYGLVIESSEYIESDSENDSDSERMRRGMVRVAWHPDGNEELVKESKIKLADRSLMPGDVVRRFIAGEDSQRGYVRYTDVTCHLQIIGSNKVICNVNSKDLEAMLYWDPEPGDVTMDCWVGRIGAIFSDVTIRFHDGARCKVDEERLYYFEDIYEERDADSEFYNQHYYPGQCLKGALSELKFQHKEAIHWLNATDNYNADKVKNSTDNTKVTVVVEAVEPKGLDVHWQCRGYAKVENPLEKLEPPPAKLVKEHLPRCKKLDCFEPCSIQIGDKAFYVIKNTDVIQTIRRNGTKLSFHELFRNFINHPNAPVSLQHSNGRVIATQAPNGNGQVAEGGVALSNQNGAVAAGGGDDDDEYEDEEDYDSDVASVGSGHSGSAPSTPKKKSKGPILKTRLHKYKGKKSKAKKLPFLNRVFKIGEKVPVEVIYTFSNVEVMWQDGSIEKSIPSTQLYPIHHLDELEFFPGDFVVENREEGQDPDRYGVIMSVDHQGRTCMVKWMKCYQVGKSSRPDEEICPEEVSVYDIKDHPDYRFRPGQLVVRIGGLEENLCSEAAGQVYELVPNGTIMVKWADGSVSPCFPQELYLFSEIGDGSEWDDSDSEDTNSEAGSWETEEEQETDEECEEEKIKEVPMQLDPIEKMDLENVLDRIKSTLDKLEGMFGESEVADSYHIQCCRNIWQTFRECRELDRNLGSSFFDNSEVNEIMSSLRKHKQKAKNAKMFKQVLELFETASSKVSGATPEEVEAPAPDDRQEEAMVVDTVSSEACEEEKTDQSDAAKVDANGQSDGVESAATAEIGAVAATPAETDIVKKAARGLIKPDIGMLKVDLNETRTLCQNACRVLRNQISKFQEELDRRFQNTLAATNADKESAKQPIDGSTSNSSDIVKEDGEKGKEATGNCDVDSTDPESQDTVGTMLEAKSDLSPVKKDIHRHPSIDETLKLHDGFSMVEEVPDCHKFKGQEFAAADAKSFFSSITRELKLLRCSLPHGIFVKGFEERMDLFSAMIVGPDNTPYQDGLFFFDMSLKNDHPFSPPAIHYHSFCSDRLNPNLYEDGKVCVSLLGTWDGKGTEVWTKNSTLLQVIVSIQGLILVDEPYYNEAGYERHKGTQEGQENSRMYNEMAILKMVQSMIKIAVMPPSLFETEIREHLSKNAFRMIRRLRRWLEISEAQQKRGSGSTRKSRTSSSEEAGTTKLSLENKGPPVSNAEEAQKAESSGKMATDLAGSEDGAQKAVDGTPSSLDSNQDSSNGNNGSKSSSPAAAGGGEGSPEAPSGDEKKTIEKIEKPEFPLLPGSKGFCISIRKALTQFESILQSKNIEEL